MDDIVNKYKEDANKNDLLIWACARGLLPDVVELIKQGADASTKDKKGFFALHYASSHGHTEVCEFLSTRGVDIEIEDPQGRYPLHYAALGGHTSTTRFLSSKMVWLDNTDSSDNTALHLAARIGSESACKILAQGGAKLDLVNKRGLTPLGEAVAGGHLEVAKLLLQMGADVNVFPRGFSLLHIACGLSMDEVAAWLLVSKLDVNNATNPEGLTALHAAAMAGSMSCVELLLKNGSNPNAVNVDDQFPVDMVPTDADDVAALVARLQAASSKSSKGKKTAFTGKKAAAASDKNLNVKSEVSEKQENSEEPFTVRFSRLSKDEQLRKVETYSRMDEGAVSQLSYLWPQACDAISEVRQASQLLECIKALSMLRADLDFQLDVVDPTVKASLEVIKQTNEPERFKGNSQVQSVMTKMNKLQAVLRANGNPKISLEDLLAAPKGPNSVAETNMRVQGMSQALVRMRGHVAAVLSGASSTLADARAAAQGPKHGMTTVSSSQKNVKNEIEEIYDPSDITKPEKSVFSMEDDMQMSPYPTTWRGWLERLGWELLRTLALLLFCLGSMWMMGMLPYQLAAQASFKTTESEATNIEGMKFEI